MPDLKDIAKRLTPRDPPEVHGTLFVDEPQALSCYPHRGLKRDVPGDSAKVLIQQLKELEAVLRLISRRPRLAVECQQPTKKATFKRPSQSFHQRPQLAEGLNRSRGRGYGPTLVVRERPVTRLYVGE